MAVKALFLNYTLKESPHVCYISSLVGKMISFIERSHAKSKIRTAALNVEDNSVDNKVSVDNNTDHTLTLGADVIFNILVIAACIWFGVLSSITKLAIMKLDRIDTKKNPEIGQYSFYTKNAGINVSGKVDLAHDIFSDDRLLPIWCAVL